MVSLNEISLVLIAFALISFDRLPLREYPDIARL